jgi:hypothetical protein
MFFFISDISDAHLINLFVNEKYSTYLNRIGGVMVSVLASSVVDRGFEHRSDQTEDYNIGICCFSTEHTTLRK